MINYKKINGSRNRTWLLLFLSFFSLLLLTTQQEIQISNNVDLSTKAIRKENSQKRKSICLFALRKIHFVSASIQTDFNTFETSSAAV